MKNQHKICSLAQSDTIRKKQKIVVIIDRSGSMKGKAKAVFSSAHTLLDRLAQENLDNTEVSYEVRVLVFNDKVCECTGSNFLSPENAREMLTEDEYPCIGSTSLAAVYDYLDSHYSRSEDGFLANLSAGDPLPVLLMPTDMEETDSADRIATASRKLLNNRFFTQSKRIVIFVGNSGSKKQAAATIAGGEENVISVDTNMIEYLSPVLLNATLLRSDSTHLGNMTTTPQETGKDILDKTRSAEASVENLTDEELEKELEKFLA